MVSNFRRYSLLICFLIFCSAVSGQNIKGHYVAKNQEDGTIYHTMPVTLFENSEVGDLTYDLTCKQQSGVVQLNFTYKMKQPFSADSVRFVSGATVFSGPVQKMYAEPDKKEWKHRYSLSVNVKPFYTFYDEKTLPEVTLWSGSKAYVYKAKKSAWKGYAPVGCKIFEMIRFNEK